MTNPKEDAFLDRIRGFLEFLRSKLSGIGIDSGKVTHLRHASDIRIRQARLKKPELTPSEICRIINPDPNKIAFDGVAMRCGLFTREQLDTPEDPLGEKLSLFREAAILQETIRMETMLQFVNEYIDREAPPTDEPDVSAATEEPPPMEGLPPRVQKLLGKVRDLWSIPQVTQKVLELLAVPDTDIGLIAEEMEKDPGLASQVLRVVNSAYYGVTQQVGSLRRAIAMLGYKTSRRIVTLSSLVSKLGDKHGEVDFDLKAFWGHSLWVAHAASQISEATGRGRPDEHFTAGLLHDIGKLIEYQHMRAYMKQIVDGVRWGGSYEQVERRIIETDHAQIGAVVCERWGFPKFVVEAVRHHLQTPEQVEEAKVSRTAMVVSACCNLGTRATEEQAKKWVGMMRLTLQRFSEIGDRATQLSLDSLREFFVYG